MGKLADAVAAAADDEAGGGSAGAAVDNDDADNASAADGDLTSWLAPRAAAAPDAAAAGLQMDIAGNPLLTLLNALDVFNNSQAIVREAFRAPGVFPFSTGPPAPAAVWSAAAGWRGAVGEEEIQQDEVEGPVGEGNGDGVNGGRGAGQASEDGTEPRSWIRAIWSAYISATSFETESASTGADPAVAAACAVPVPPGTAADCVFSACLDC